MKITGFKYELGGYPVGLLEYCIMKNTVSSPLIMVARKKQMKKGIFIFCQLRFPSFFLQSVKLTYNHNG